MFFEPGFFGTAAPLYLDLATSYFFILPFLILYSISYAIKKQYKKHYISQFVIIVITFGWWIPEIFTRFILQLCLFIDLSACTHCFSSYDFVVLDLFCFHLL